MKRIVLVTGCSTGFGKFLVRESSKLGYICIGTVRKQEQVKEIDQISAGLSFGAVLDVNKHQDAATLVNNIIGKHGRIDALINNAGYGFMGAIEEATMTEAREQMETNFFGALNLTQLVLPHMRKQTSGHIIQISSLAGFNSTPGLGLYNASKYALEGFSEALAKEAAHLGIKVTIVEPGPFKTGSSMKLAAKQIDAYNESAGVVRDRIRGYSGKQPGDPQRGAEAIVSLIAMPQPPLRLPLGRVAVGGIRAKLAQVTEDVNRTEAIAVATDFPKDSKL